MQLEDFFEEYSKDHPFEYINGQRIELPLEIARSGLIRMNFAYRLYDHIEAHDGGEVFYKLPVVLMDENEPQEIRVMYVPSVIYLSHPHMERYVSEVPDWEAKPMMTAPDFIFEIVQIGYPGNMDEKIAGYLRDGVRLIWLMEPIAKTVTVYRYGSTQHTVYAGESDLLDAGDVINGFSITLKELVKSHKYTSD